MGDQSRIGREALRDKLVGIGKIVRICTNRNPLVEVILKRLWLFQ
jgi:hypothetical protein